MAGPEQKKEVIVPVNPNTITFEEARDRLDVVAAQDEKQIRVLKGEDFDPFKTDEIPGVRLEE